MLVAAALAGMLAMDGTGLAFGAEANTGAAESSALEAASVRIAIVASRWASAHCGYVDADGDGICDNWENGTGGQGYGAGNGDGYGFVDADGDGVCDNWDEAWCGCGQGFVDENGDGVCDNWAGKWSGGGQGGGQGYGAGNGGGMGRGARGR